MIIIVIIIINNDQGGGMILECVISRLSAPPKTLHWLKGGQVGHHHRQHHHCFHKKKQFKDAMLINLYKRQAMRPLKISASDGKRKARAKY